MSNYKLNILFDSESLCTIYHSNEKVVLVKHTSADEGEASHVAWVTFNPFKKNTIEWNTDFAVYTSNNINQPNVTIRNVSNNNISESNSYCFSQGTFQCANSAANSDINTVEVKNASTDEAELVFGLTQSAVVNGEEFNNHPISAVTVPFGQKVDITPYESIDVCLQSNVESGAVLEKIGSVNLSVDFEEKTEHTISYDVSTGAFYHVE